MKAQDRAARIAPLLVADRRMYNLVFSTSAALIGIHVIARHDGLGDVLRGLATDPAVFPEDAIEEIVKDAQAEIEAEFVGILSTSAIGCWAAMESGIRDFAVSWVQHHAYVKKHEKVRSIKVNLSVFEGMSPAGRARYIIEELERTLNASQKRGIGRFEQLLSILELGPHQITDEVQRTMVEFYAVRNLFAHRLGMIDERFLNECPWFQESYGPGDQLIVTHEDLRRYVKAASEYLKSLMKRAIFAPVDES